MRTKTCFVLLAAAAFSAALFAPACATRDLRATIDLQSAQIQRSDARAVESEHRIKVLQTRLEQTRSDLDTAEGRERKLAASEEALRVEIEEQDMRRREQIAAFSSEQDGHFKAAQAREEGLLSKLSGLQNEMARRDTRLAADAAEMEGLRKSVGELTATVEARDSRIAALDDETAALSEEAEAANRRGNLIAAVLGSALAVAIVVAVVGWARNWKSRHAPDLVHWSGPKPHAGI